MTRTFIAIELNDEARSYLYQQIQQLARLLPRVRWVDPETLHLTLAFLGELDETQLEQAMQATAETAQTTAPFAVSIGSLGTFGPAHNPHVIWIGLAGRLQPLLGLQASLVRRLVQAGFPPEERAYAPHLTLARIKTALSQQEVAALKGRIAGRAGSGSHALQAGKDVDVLPEIPVAHLSVMKSDVTREGPHYTRLLHSPLAG